jgi:hypothetical protein
MILLLTWFILLFFVVFVFLLGVWYGKCKGEVIRNEIMMKIRDYYYNKYGGSI